MQKSSGYYLIAGDLIFTIKSKSAFPEYLGYITGMDMFAKDLLIWFKNNIGKEYAVKIGYDQAIIPSQAEAALYKTEDN